MIVLRKICGKTKINGVNNNRTRVKMKEKLVWVCGKKWMKEPQMKANVLKLWPKQNNKKWTKLWLWDLAAKSGLTLLARKSSLIQVKNFKTTRNK